MSGRSKLNIRYISGCRDTLINVRWTIHFAREFGKKVCYKIGVYGFVKYTRQLQFIAISVLLVIDDYSLSHEILIFL